MKASKAVAEFICGEFKRWNERLKSGVVPAKLGWFMTALFAGYLFLVLTARTPSLFYPPLLLAPIYFAVVLLLLVAVLNRVSAASGLLNIKVVEVSPKAFMLSVAFVYLIWCFCANPGTNPDIEYQMRQVHAFRFTDWHPILHTMTLWLFTRIWDSMYLISFVQSAFFVVLCGWLYCSLLKKLPKGAALLVSTFVALNPVNFGFMIIAMKDVAFALSVFGLFIAVLNIQISEGEWICKWRNILLFAILLFLSSFYRHNGIFLTMPLVVMLVIWQMRILAKVCVLISIFAAVVLSLSYVYAKQVKIVPIVVDSAEQNQTFSETIGLPMCGIARAYFRDYNRTPDCARKLVEAFGTRDRLLQSYKGDYNSFKFLKDRGCSAGEALKRASVNNIGQLANIFIETLRRSPGAVVGGVRDVTGMVWNPFTTELCTMYGSNRFAQELYWVQNVLLSPPVGWLFSSIGLVVMVLFYLLTIGFSLRGFVAWLYAVPLFAYAVGTMLLLCGPTWWYFYALILVVPIVIVGYVSQNKKQ